MRRCPRCGGTLNVTANPRKLQCEECGRVFKNYNTRYFKCERCSQPCYIIAPYEIPEQCPYGFSSSKFREITPQNLLRCRK